MKIEVQHPHDAAEKGAEGQTSGSVRGIMVNMGVEEVSEPGLRHAV